MTIYFYDATEGPGLLRTELVAVALEAKFTVLPENVVHERLDRLMPALSRPVLNRLARAEHRDDIVVCSELDRLGNNIHDIQKTVYQMRLFHIGLFCLELPGRIDLASPKGSPLLAAMSAYAKLMTTVHGSRVRVGQAKSKSMGNELGRRVELSDANQKQILLLILQGHKVSAVAKQLGINRWAVNRTIERASLTASVNATKQVVGYGLWA